MVLPLYCFSFFPLDKSAERVWSGDDIIGPAKKACDYLFPNRHVPYCRILARGRVLDNGLIVVLHAV